jgi:hypothetical protein
VIRIKWSAQAPSKLLKEFGANPTNALGIPYTNLNRFTLVQMIFVKDFPFEKREKSIVETITFHHQGGKVIDLISHHHPLQAMSCS